MQNTGSPTEASLLQTSSKSRRAPAPDEGVAGGLMSGQAFYRALIDAAPDAILVVDFEWTILFCNPQAALLYGYEDPTGLTGRSALEQFSPDEAEAVIEEARELLLGGTVSTI